MIRRTLGFCALTVLFMAGAWAAGLDPALEKLGYEHITFEGEAPNRFTLAEDGVILVDSDQSVSLIERPLDRNLGERPILTWRWRVDEGVPPTDLTQKGGDDRSLAIYVTFPFRPEEASVFERMKREMVEAFAGTTVPGRVICYVFGGRGERGEVQANPWFGDAGANVILRPADGASGRWFEERVDLAADYERIFGSPWESPTHLAISADSDDTRSRIRALVDGFSFAPP